MKMDYKTKGNNADYLPNIFLILKEFLLTLIENPVSRWNGDMI